MMRSPLFLALAMAVGAGTPLLAGQASAQTTRAVRATAEMSMVLSGHIEITPEGEVSSLVLDQKSTLTPSIASFVEPEWHGPPPRPSGRALPRDGAGACVYVHRAAGSSGLPSVPPDSNASKPSPGCRVTTVDAVRSATFASGGCVCGVVEVVRWRLRNTD